MKKPIKRYTDGSFKLLDIKFNSISDAAKHFGYSYDMMYKVVNEKNEPSDKICKMCGYKKKVTKKTEYVKLITHEQSCGDVFEDIGLESPIK